MLSPFSPEDLRTFIATGALRLDHAFEPEEAAAAIWAAAGLSPDDPAGWPSGVVRIPYLAHPALVAAVNTPRLSEAYDALVGRGRWVAPSAVGSLPLRFPSAKDPGDTGWHVDMALGFDQPDFMDWRVNVRSDGRALLVLMLFSEVGEDDAPTRLRLGSHKAVARGLLPHGLGGLSLRDLAADGFEETAGGKEVLATGPAGTAWLCHPFLVHSAQPHRGRRPRLMAQQTLAPAHPFDSALPPSPVQQAIREACGLSFGVDP